MLMVAQVQRSFAEGELTGVVLEHVDGSLRWLQRRLVVAIDRCLGGSLFLGGVVCFAIGEVFELGGVGRGSCDNVCEPIAKAAAGAVDCCVRAVDLSYLNLAYSHDISYYVEHRTLMPCAASLSRLCCWVSFNVKLLRPLKMMGSTLHVLSE